MSDYQSIGFDQFLQRTDPNSIPQQLDPQQFAIFTDQIAGDKMDSEISGNLIGAGITADNIDTGTMSFDRASGGSLILGGKKNQNGTFSLRDENNNDKVTMDKDGMIINDGAMTIKNANGSTIVDSQGVTSSNFATNSGTVNDNSNQKILTVDPIYTLLTNASFTIIVKRTTTVLILFTGSAWITRNSGAGNFGANARFSIFLDGSSVKGYLMNGTLIGTDSRGSLDASAIIGITHLRTLTPGTHSLEMKAALIPSGLSGDPVLNVYNHSFSYVLLGS